MKAALLAIAGSGGILMGVAGPATAQTSGNFHETAVTVEPGGPAIIILSGAVNAVCKEGGGTFRPGPNGTFSLETTTTCPGGDLFATVVGHLVSFKVDPRTCVGRRVESSTTTFTGGTNQFAGATGSTTDVVHFTLIFRRGAEGCLVDQPPLRSVEVLQLIGTIDLPPR